MNAVILRYARVSVCALAIFGLAACAKTTVVLLPNDDGEIGEVTVRNLAETETKVLSQDSQMLTVSNDGLSEVKTTTNDYVDRYFADAISVMPKPPSWYVIYFATGSYAPQEDPAKLFPPILADIKGRVNPEVYVSGHTDRTGSAQINETISRKRAEQIASMLESRGIASDIMSIQYFGPNMPLVPYEKGKKFEPKNRRVEVMAQ